MNIHIGVTLLADYNVAVASGCDQVKVGYEYICI
jgi:hypothetical protein